jgi:hypothetical protein
VGGQVGRELVVAAGRVDEPRGVPRRVRQVEEVRVAALEQFVVPVEAALWLVDREALAPVPYCSLMAFTAARAPFITPSTPPPPSLCDPANHRFRTGVR